jgi:hypothetical protein
LWYALEERRDQIRAAGLPFSERQHHYLREAHDEGKLIQRLCDVETYKGNADAENRAMAQAIKRGLPTLEDVLIRRGEPWTPYVRPACRRGAQTAIADAKAYIPFV